jgi:small basic protein (TIGR04137 family)
MSIHSSLRSGKAAAHTRRNVLKRHERIRHLMAHGTWVDGRSVFGLPKIKQTKIKTRKATTKENAETSTESAATKLAAST